MSRPVPGPLLRTRPILSIAVFAVTVAFGCAQLAWPRLLLDLERLPAGLHGDWWRTATFLLVQDGGLSGFAINASFALILGALAEQTCSRSVWLMQYIGVGCASALIAYAWQPNGGGNSVAVCGLAAMIVYTAFRRRHLDLLSATVVLMWVASLIVTEWSHWAVPAFVVAGVLSGFLRLRAQRGARIDLACLGVVVVVAILLCARQNIHGAALALGLLSAAALHTRGNRPSSPRPNPTTPHGSQTQPVAVHNRSCTP